MTHKDMTFLKGLTEDLGLPSIEGTVGEFLEKYPTPGFDITKIQHGEVYVLPCSQYIDAIVDGDKLPSDDVEQIPVNVVIGFKNPITNKMEVYEVASNNDATQHEYRSMDLDTLVEGQLLRAVEADKDTTGLLDGMHEYVRNPLAALFG